MGELIKAENLSLKYKKEYVLKDVTFSLEKGMVYGLLGRNGAGKTSLLSIMASLQRPTSGTLTIDGENPFENARIMQRVSYIYDRDYKDDSTPVKEILEMAERYRPDFDREYAEYLMQKFELPPDKPVKKLSKGKQSALNITVGLASRSPLTIFDEAYLGMDAPARELFYRELLEDREKDPRTFFLSTHLVSEMDYLFDEVLILHKGKLLLHEDYETFISKGTTVTGEAEKVDGFVRGKEVLNEQQLGPVKSVMIFGRLSDREKETAEAIGLELGPVKLQDLFIHLTEERK